MSENHEAIDLDGLSATTYSAVFSDVCDAAGRREQTFEPGLRLLAGNSGVLVGWARTAVSRPVSDIPDRPYGGEIDFIDSLRPGDVAIVDCSGRPAAAWGELFSTASVGRGARGAIIDGYVRDIDKIEALGRFPVYGRGARPTDSLGRVSIQEQDTPVSVYGRTVHPGDLVICDRDGVTFVPGAIALEIAEKAREKASKENSARELLLNGGYLRDVWERFRVL
ncbi:RraA family protein [Nitratireductor sp. XY-223]|uniref:RraA family protein n=1 Tax=Nitratireductor sp. XY-223 TaxID=2561926 RepID=UPI0010A9CA02|nr:RraA family protein [Nitratireductor sp. XY-223]